MACPDHETLVSFADGALELDEAARIDRHLEGCSTCRGFVEEMRRLDATCRSAMDEVAVSGAQRTFRVLGHETRFYLRRPVQFAAAAVVVFGLAAWFANRPMRKPATAAVIASVDRGTNQTQTASADRFTMSSDEAFERWAQPYRQLRVPLVPMEQVAKNFEEKL